MFPLCQRSDLPASARMGMELVGAEAREIAGQTMYGKILPAASRKDRGRRNWFEPWAPDGSPTQRFSPSPATVLHHEAGQAILGLEARIPQDWPGGHPVNVVDI